MVFICLGTENPEMHDIVDSDIRGTAAEYVENGLSY